MAIPEESPTEPRHVPGPPARRGARTGTLVVGGPIDRSDLPRLERRLRTIAAVSPDGAIACDVSRLVRPDAAAVDTLARLQVLARRHGRTIRLINSSPELRQLLVCMGLVDALPVEGGTAARSINGAQPPPRGDGSGWRHGRQAEERE